MKLKSVSIIIPMYNHANLVTSCLESIARIQFRPLEVIVIDDYSTDESFQVAKLYMDQNFLNKGIKYQIRRNPQNYGPGKSLNIALQLARHTHIMAFASDDVYIPENVDKVLGYFSGYNVHWLINEGFTHQLDQIHGERVRNFLSQGPKKLLKHLYTNLGFIFVQSTIIAKVILRKIGGWDADRETSEDWSLTIKITKHLIEQGIKYHYTDIPVFIYRDHPGNSYKNTPLQVTRIINCIDKYVPAKYGITLKNREVLAHLTGLWNEYRHVLFELNAIKRSKAYAAILILRKLKNRFNIFDKVFAFGRRVVTITKSVFTKKHIKAYLRCLATTFGII
ncbi:MAG: glycosyltransferase family 2 protein [Patescibacteria group bacterium]|nr:glycosyltransferase family 2 protein [Patescibacteria group bacterium]